MSNLKRAVFLDRDDTVMVNVPYLNDASQVVLFPEAKEQLARLDAAGFLLFIVSNQSAIGRGLATREEVDAVMLEMARQLFPVPLAEICYSPDAPEQPSTTRKPEIGLLLQIRDKYGVDLSRSFMVGDKECDVLCGKRAGCCSLWLHRDIFPKTETPPDFAASTLKEAADYILSQP